MAAIIYTLFSLYDCGFVLVGLHNDDDDDDDECRFTRKRTKARWKGDYDGIPEFPKLEAGKISQFQQAFTQRFTAVLLLLRMMMMTTMMI